MKTTTNGTQPQILKVEYINNHCQCVTNIRIYSNIQIFSTKYWIFEYEYWNFQQRIYSDIRIIDQWYSNIWLFEYFCKFTLFHSLKLYLKQLWSDYSPKTLMELNKRVKKCALGQFILEIFEYSMISIEYSNIFNIRIHIRPKLKRRIYSYSYSSQSWHLEYIRIRIRW